MLCATLGLLTVMFLQMLRFGLVESQKAYIEGYRRVSILTPMAANTKRVANSVAVNEFGITVKLAFGTANMPAWEVAVTDFPTVREWLAINTPTPDRAMVLIHHDALTAAEAGYGLPENIRELPLETFRTGPRVAIVVREIITPSAYLVPGHTSRVSGYAAKDYVSEARKLMGKHRFISAMVLSLATLVAMISLIASAASVHLLVRGRISEFAIMESLGHSRVRTITQALLDISVTIGSGTAVGTCVGWALGYALVSIITPGGVKPYWPDSSMLFILTMPAALCAVGLATILIVMSRVDPVAVIARAEMAQ